MFDGKYLGAWNLVDAKGAKRDVTVQIDSVRAEKITMEGGVQNKKPLIAFRGKELPMVCCKTNAKTIATMYGPDTSKWVGRWITLYPTTTQVGGAEKDCIRVRPQPPTAPAPAKDGAAREPGEEG